ncbi:MAG: class I SAM-dependent methyltransferase [Saprospiraceae bacterium]
MDKIIIVKNRNYYRKRIEFILLKLDLLNSSILDLGCGEMLLKKIIERFSPLKYTGIDQFKFAEDVDFIQTDILEYGKNLKNQFDFIFCLGVLDHLTADQSKFLIDNYKLSFKKMMIISHSNFNNPFLKFFGKANSQEYIHELNIVDRMYLIKLPLTQILFKLPSGSYLSKILATEIIYFCYHLQK